MPAIVDFPTIVHEALAVFGSVFDTEAARRHFAEYFTTGLMIAEKKTVSGINREFVVTTHQKLGLGQFERTMDNEAICIGS